MALLPGQLSLPVLFYMISEQRSSGQRLHQRHISRIDAAVSVHVCAEIGLIDWLPRARFHQTNVGGVHGAFPEKTGRLWQRRHRPWISLPVPPFPRQDVMHRCAVLLQPLTAIPVLLPERAPQCEGFASKTTTPSRKGKIMTNNIVPRSGLTWLPLVAAFIFFASTLWATTTTWTGASSNDWFTAGNWTNGVPTSATDAFINSGKATIYGPGAVARTLTLGQNSGDSGELIVDGTNGGALSVTLDCRNPLAPEYVGNGIYVSYGGSGAMSILNGEKVISSYGCIALLSSDRTHPASNGAVTIDGAGSEWTLNGCPDARLFVGGDNTTANPGGTALLTVTGGAVNINSSYDYVAMSVGPSGTVTSDATFTIDGISFLSRLMAVKGTLAPNGTLAVLGNLGIEPNATEVHNVTPTTADMIDVKMVSSQGGLVSLAGKLEVNISGIFTPSPTVVRYTLLTSEAGFVSGYTMFPRVSLKYPTDQGFTPTISYDQNHVYLDINFN